MRKPVAAVATLVLVGSLLALAPPASGDIPHITIVRDRFGVPHVYGETANAVSYGAGYALAQDRLWQMYLFSKIAKGQLSDVFGPSVEDIDKTVRFFTYTQPERIRAFQSMPGSLQSMLESFADGVNGWINVVNQDPSKRPMEFQEYGVPLPRWSTDDSVALQDVLILAFGSGGGNELAQLGLLQDLRARLGPAKGLAAFNDLVRTNDPDAPVSIPRTFDWRHSSTFARVQEAESARALTPDARISLSSASSSSSAAPAAAAKGTLAQLRLAPDANAALAQTGWLQKGLDELHYIFRFGSNAQIVAPRLSKSGNTAETAGPQVGYLLPQWLTDIGLYGGGFHATGMTFAGVGPAVLIGRGPGFAWTTTTGAGDITDTYIEKLNPANDHQYWFDGQWENMECRTETYTFRQMPFDQQPICRTRHGPVEAWDTAHNVAYSVRYAWFNREVQTVEGFFGFNFANNIQDFATDAEMLASNHNMFYVDDQGNYGYWTPGNFIRRAPGIDLRLPQDGTGGSEWQGLLPIQQVPHAVDFPRGWLANWNNEPAAGWARERAYAARTHAFDLFTAYQHPGTVRDPFGGFVNDSTGKWNFSSLSANLRYVAFRDHDFTFFRSAFPARTQLRNTGPAWRALAVLHSWRGFLVDRNDDGLYDSAGVTILNQWLGDLLKRVFANDLGSGYADWARTYVELWHVVSPDSTATMHYNWLNGKRRAQVVASTFAQAVSQLAKRYKNNSPATWLTKDVYEHYQRLNADLPEDMVSSNMCSSAEQSPFGCQQFMDPRYDSHFPGDLPDQIYMDRGTYNHVVQYMNPPTGSGVLGASAVRAGSVIPPGQSGFIAPWGQESTHYRDQAPLYLNWGYKPMPLTEPQAMRYSESVETVPYSG